MRVRSDYHNYFVKSVPFPVVILAARQRAEKIAPAMSRPTVRVLLAEDVPTEAELQVRELRRAGIPVTHRVVQTEDKFVDALRQFAPDVILSDFSMPNFDGMKALEIAREQTPDVPFIFVSGTIGEEYAIRALKNGATDYVLKTNLARLPPALERAISEAQQRRAQRRIEIELHLARERLTSISNTLPDMLWSADGRGERLLFASPAASGLFGHGPEEFQREASLWIHLADDRDRPRFEEAWKRLLAGEALDIEYRTRWPDGTVRWINQRARPVRSAGGALERIDGIARDITEQVEHRQRIERLSRIRGLLGAVNSAIVRIRERAALYQEFCRIAVAKGGFLRARIIEIRDGHARLAATTEGDSQEYRALLDGYNRNPGKSKTLVARAIRTEEPVVVNDMAKDDSGTASGPELAPGESYAVALLPIRVDGQLDGLVALRSNEPDFFDSDELALLSEMVGNVSFALELIDKQERIAYMALYDALTRLPNRTLFQEHLNRAIESADRAKSPLGLVLLDLERFKAINDVLGAPAGDAVLQAVAGRLEETAGDLGRVGRLAGDVFAIMLPDAGAEHVAHILEAGQFFKRPFQAAGREFRLAGKRGVAVYPDDGRDADTLFRNAEAALKRAKETGESYMFYAPSINARVAERVELENRLRKALEQGELYFHYQPKLELATKRIVGLEALMRWNGPDGKPVPPAKFVPILEQTGLILEAGQMAVRNASATHARWRARGIRAPRIAVNVSALQLRRQSFVAEVRAALVEAAADGGGVDLEITESLLMSDVEDTIRKLKELRESGLRIALDDFGTGYSSLSYLSRLPLDALKIDRSFVRGMLENAADMSIITSIISLARGLKLKLIAEGIETDAQAERLLTLGCDEGQGYLFSRPLPREEVEALLSAQP